MAGEESDGLPSPTLSSLCGGEGEGPDEVGEDSSDTPLPGPLPTPSWGEGTGSAPAVVAGVGGDRSICAPIKRGVSRAICWEMQLSASATARPPSLQSCALFTTPE